MIDQETILLLQARRPGGQDDEDPMVADALEAAQEEEAVRHWLAAEQKFDLEISRRLAEVQPPAELLERLLAQRVVAPGSFREQLPAWIGLAASVVLLVYVALNWRTDLPVADFAAFRAEIVPETVRVQPHLEVLDNDLAALGRALTERGAPAPGRLPEALERIKPTGCRVIDWNDRKVSMLCYRDGPLELHLLVVERRGFLGAPEGDLTLPVQAGPWAVAAWVDEERIYLLAGRTTADVLQRYLL
ncbi:MAG: hypothetical protein D6766_14450 [Verrucomicrobia bacterium]|nr:MAG: hypothetical protein D6766_14450 [Verrucomicrobiota bacterium]